MKQNLVKKGFIFMINRNCQNKYFNDSYDQFWNHSGKKWGYLGSSFPGNLTIWREIMIFT